MSIKSYQSTCDGHAPAEEEGVNPCGVVTEQDWLEWVVEAEVEAAVDEDADAADDEAAVETSDSVCKGKRRNLVKGGFDTFGEKLKIIFV